MSINPVDWLGLFAKALSAISNLFSQGYAIFLNWRVEKQVRELDRLKDNETRRKFSEQEYLNQLKQRAGDLSQQHKTELNKPLDYDNRKDLEDL